MENKTLENYIAYIIECIKEDAKEAKKLAEDSDKNTNESFFYYGKRLAYYEVLTTIINQAKVFNISNKDLGLDNFDPDKEIA